MFHTVRFQWIFILKCELVANRSGQSLLLHRMYDSSEYSSYWLAQRETNWIKLTDKTCLHVRASRMQNVLRNYSSKVTSWWKFPLIEDFAGLWNHCSGQIGWIGKSIARLSVWPWPLTFVSRVKYCWIQLQLADKIGMGHRGKGIRVDGISPIPVPMVCKDPRRI